MSIVIQKIESSYYENYTEEYFPNEILETIFENLDFREKYNFCILDKRTLNLFHKNVFKFYPLSFQEAIKNEFKEKVYHSDSEDDYFWIGFHSGNYRKNEDTNPLHKNNFTLHEGINLLKEDRFKTKEEIISREAGRCFASLVAQFIAFGISSVYYDSSGTLLFSWLFAYHFGILGGLGYANSLHFLFSCSLLSFENHLSALALTVSSLFLTKINKKEFIFASRFSQHTYNLSSFIFSPFRSRDISLTFTKIYKIVSLTYDFTNIYITKRKTI